MISIEKLLTFNSIVIDTNIIDTKYILFAPKFILLYKTYNRMGVPEFILLYKMTNKMNYI